MRGARVDPIQRCERRGDFPGAGTVAVAWDTRELRLDVRLMPVERRVLQVERPRALPDGGQSFRRPFDSGASQSIGDIGRGLARLLRGEHLLVRRGRCPLFGGSGSGASARRAVRSLQLGQMRGRIFGIGRIRSRLLQSDPQRGGFLAGHSGQFSRRLQLVRAPDLPQDPASLRRFVFHQQAGETPLRQDDGAQERVTVEPDQILDALVDRLDLFDQLDRLAVGTDSAEPRACRPDLALPTTP